MDGMLLFTEETEVADEVAVGSAGSLGLGR